MVAVAARVRRIAWLLAPFAPMALAAALALLAMTTGWILAAFLTPFAGVFWDSSFCHSSTFL